MIFFNRAFVEGEKKSDKLQKKKSHNTCQRRTQEKKKEEL